ncbi:hypothetical protein [Streptomyces inhibens]|uniref:hypothetical protein n=1 Tax=Streptomyces inhibens TaxID=2293571 RepID=UPI001EE6D25F|nr:hypothetical protein [Streptomyces inhibens]UKY49262.1 hypothetical protein KI385_10940 [Streptomyces inhibens]
MQTKTVNGKGSYDQPPPDERPASATTSLVAGVAVGIGAMGAVLALADIGSPLRAPFTLFFLLMAPATAIATALGRMDPLGRAVAAGAGALAVDLLVAQAMLALHLWSVRGGVVAVAALSGAVLLGSALRRRAGRAHGNRAD